MGTIIFLALGTRAQTDSTDAFCSSYASTCSTTGRSAAYSNCTSQVSTMAPGTSNAPSDTFSCRHFHLDLAMSSPTNSVIHCPHASPSGGGVCVNASPPAPPGFCAAYLTTCADTNSSAAYTDCASAISSMTPGTSGSYSGNTLACRQDHLVRATPHTAARTLRCTEAVPSPLLTCLCGLAPQNLAMISASNAVIHCPHASATGGGVCVESPPPPPPPPIFCATYQSVCAATSFGAAYNDCAVAVAGMLAGTPGSNSPGDTLACRVCHLPPLPTARHRSLLTRARPPASEIRAAEKERQRVACFS